MRKLGLLDEKWKFTPTVGDWEKVQNKEWEARCMEVYAAMLDRMDQGIGRMVAELDKLGQLQNTLIFLCRTTGLARRRWAGTERLPVRRRRRCRRCGRTKIF